MGRELEGLAANDLSLAVEGAGPAPHPPPRLTRARDTQRIYVPRQAIQSLEVVSLIGAASRRRAAETAARQKEQPEPLPRRSGIRPPTPEERHKPGAPGLAFETRDASNSSEIPVPHPFDFFLSNGWDT